MACSVGLETPLARHDTRTREMIEGRPNRRMVDLTLWMWCPPCSTTGTRRKAARSPDEERILFFGVPAVSRTEVPQAAERGEGRLDRGDNGHSFAGWRDDGLLDDRRRFIDPPRELGDQPIDLLGLRRRERDGPRGLFGNRVRASISGRTS